MERFTLGERQVSQHLTCFFGTLVEMKYKLIRYDTHLSKSQSNTEIFQNMKDGYLDNRL